MTFLKHKWLFLAVSALCVAACKKGNSGEIAAEKAPDAQPSHEELILPALSWDVSDTTAVAVSPDGKRVAVGERRAIHIFDAATLEPVRSYELGDKEGRAALNTERAIERMKWSPDGKFIATESDNGAVRLWNLKSGKHGMVTMYMDGVNGMVFSPSGRLFATSGTMISRNELEVVEVHPRSYLLILKKDWSRFSFSPDEREIWARTYEGLQGWKLKKGAEPRKVPGVKRELSYEMVPDGKTLLVQVEEKVEIHQLGKGRRAVLEDAKRVPYRPGYSPDAKLILDGYDNQILVWKLDTGKLVRRVPIPNLYDAAVSNDGKVAAVHADIGFAVWDLEKKSKRNPPERHEAEVVSANLSPDDKLLITSCKDGFVRMWSVPDGKLLWRTQSSWMSQMAFSSDGKRLAGAAESRQLHHFDARTGKMEMNEDAPAVKTVSFGARGELRTTFADYEGKFRVTSGKDTHKFTVKDFDPQWHALSADGAHLIAANWEEIRVLDAKTGAVQASLKQEASHFAATPDGTLVALGGTSSNEVVLWSTKGNVKHRLKVGSEAIVALCFSGDGKRLAVVDEDYDSEYQSIFVLDAQSGKQLRKYLVKSKWVIQELLLSHNGDFVVYRAINDVGILRAR